MLVSLLCLFALNAVNAANFTQSVIASKPLAYFRFESPSGSSAVNGFTYNGLGPLVAIPGAPIGNPTNQALLFNGLDTFVNTSLVGGIAAAGTLMAWVNLSILPSTYGRIYYIGGEAEDGNDMDLQFQTDNALYWFTDGGPSIGFVPPIETLVGQWHMIVVTMDIRESGVTTAIYWDGVPVSVDSSGSGKTGKKTVFLVGQSNLWKMRFFNGAIDEVAVWDRALNFLEVWGLFLATRN